MTRRMGRRGEEGSRATGEEGRGGGGMVTIWCGRRREHFGVGRGDGVVAARRGGGAQAEHWGQGSAAGPDHVPLRDALGGGAPPRRAAEGLGSSVGEAGVCQRTIWGVARERPRVRNGGLSEFRRYGRFALGFRRTWAPPARIFAREPQMGSSPGRILGRSWGLPNSARYRSSASLDSTSLRGEFDGI